jgi:hypothetical protein
VEHDLGITERGRRVQRHDNGIPVPASRLMQSRRLGGADDPVGARTMIGMCV